MDSASLNRHFAELSTPLIADACLRLSITPRVAPPQLKPLRSGTRIAGRTRPVQHAGSVDIFLEAASIAAPGDVLVIDNDNRHDEACIGDLTALEARAQGLAALIVWGLHRDTAELLEIGFPVFSCGAYPCGPLRTDPRADDALSKASIGAFAVSANDTVFADKDGIVFAPAESAERVIETAQVIRQTERAQAERIAAGNTLYQQLRFAEYLAKRETDPAYTFRRHLRAIGGAMEE